MKKEDFLKKLEELDEADIGGDEYITEIVKAARDTELSDDDWVKVVGYMASYMCPECDIPVGTFGDMNSLIEALQD